MLWGDRCNKRIRVEGRKRRAMAPRSCLERCKGGRESAMVGAVDVSSAEVAVAAEGPL